MEDKLHIKETSIEDLENVATLWNDGEVMFYVGFPNGLGVSKESLGETWLVHVNVNSKRKHYSIYHDDLGYCGECFYSVNEEGLAALDIKLFPKARGKGIAFHSLKYAIDNAFDIGHANAVFVDPSKENTKALKLYEKFPFTKCSHPQEKYRHTHHYFVLKKEQYIVSGGD